MPSSRDTEKSALQELTLLEVDRHTDTLEKFDVEGILAFAERVLPRASDLGSKHLSISNSAFSSFFS